MSESQWSRVLFTRYTCDKRSCDAKYDITPSSNAVADNHFSARDESGPAVAEKGWTKWRNDRQSYIYCPSHAPGNATALRQVW